MQDSPETCRARWLLLIHQLPPKPPYFRVKIWRRLQRLGAVAIKNSVYVLPRSNSAQEAFAWIRREIGAGDGQASVCEAHFVDGLSDAEIEALFNAARDADYAQAAEEAQRLLDEVSEPLDESRRAQDEVETQRLRGRFDEINAIDFFGAPGSARLEELLGRLEARTRRPTRAAADPGWPASSVRKEMHGRTWVTRRSIHVDRMACAWLIRRSIDPAAEFKFVAGNRYAPAPDELRFDMFDAEFTHDGDLCTFEVLLERFRLDDPALRAIADIVHDIDLKDPKFARAETGGVESLIAGIAMAHKDDEARLERAEAVFSDLYVYFRRKAERDRRSRKEKPT